MTLSDFDWLTEIRNDTKHRAASLQQLTDASCLVPFCSTFIDFVISKMCILLATNDDRLKESRYRVKTNSCRWPEQVRSRQPSEVVEWTAGRVPSSPTCRSYCRPSRRTCPASSRASRPRTACIRQRRQQRPSSWTDADRSERPSSCRRGTGSHDRRGDAGTWSASCRYTRPPTAPTTWPAASLACDTWRDGFETTPNTIVIQSSYSHFH